MISGEMLTQFSHDHPDIIEMLYEEEMAQSSESSR